MKASDAKKMGTCQNCGAEHPMMTDMDVCSECCDHDHTTSELTGEYCDDCGTEVN